MIFQALAALYETLAAKGILSKEAGWNIVPVGQEICLDMDGNLLQIVDLHIPQEKGNPRSQEMFLPDWGDSNGSGVRSNLLYGQAGFILGITTRNTKPERLQKMVEDCNNKHHKCLKNVEKDVPEAAALLKFLDHIKDGMKLPEEIREQLSDKSLAADNFIFSVNGRRLHEIEEIREAWNDYFYNADDNDGEDDKKTDSLPPEPRQCLVTGEVDIPARKLPFIKGLMGAQGGGASLSSFNAPSFCSYGYEQNLNAPISRKAAYAASQALTYLLREKTYHKCMGKDLTIVWWPDSAEEEYGEFLSCSVFGGENKKWTDADIAGILENLSKGRPVDNLDPGRKFYVMGLSPNSSRIIIRFFLQDSFGEIIKNVAAHYDRLSLKSFLYDAGYRVTASWVFSAMTRDTTEKEEDAETASKTKKAKKGKDKEKEKSTDLPESVINSFFQAVLFGHPYPRQMLHMTARRITFDINNLWARISVIKAYFLQMLPENDKRRECFTMSLQTECREPAYVLGRLFALYEQAQKIGLSDSDNGRIVEEKDKKTGKRKPVPIHSMYRSAMTTPGVAFPQLNSRIEPHLSKPECGYIKKLVGEVKDLLDITTYPVRFDLVEQGEFDMGYFHQREYLFSKKSDEKEGESGTEIENEETEIEE